MTEKYNYSLESYGPYREAKTRRDELRALLKEGQSAASHAEELRQAEEALSKTWEEADLRLQQRVFSDHEQSVRKVVDAMRQLSAAFTEEESIRQAATRALGVCTPCIYPVPEGLNPGKETACGSKLYQLVNTLQKHGYQV